MKLMQVDLDLKSLGMALMIMVEKLYISDYYALHEAKIGSPILKYILVLL